MVTSQTAFLFPGQGAQTVGMGQALCAQFPKAKEIVTRANDLLGFDLGKICFEGPQEQLTRTDHAQVAILTISIAAKKAAGELLPEPQATAGLSLGEYTALVGAGALTFEDGLKLVWARGRFMEEAAQAQAGTMASILGLKLPQVEEVCQKSGAELANLNSPSQIVISGKREAVEQAVGAAKEAGAKRAMVLNVGGAFHSSLMQPAAEKLREVLESTPVEVPKFPVISNVTAQPHQDPTSIRARLAEQLTSPVRWEESVRSLLGLGIQSAYEIGPGTVLKGLFRQIERSVQVTNVQTPEDIQALGASHENAAGGAQ